VTERGLLLCLQKAPIDPFTRESCKPSASQGVPLGGMGYDALANISVFGLLYLCSHRGCFRFLYQHIAFAGVVAFQEDLGESSRIGTSFLVCVRIRR
jgi:hypothetical protein